MFNLCFREEYGKLYDFVVTQKKLRVKNVGGKLVMLAFVCILRVSGGEV